MAWSCPNAVKSKHYNFLMCKLLMKDNVNYTEKHNALKTYCAYQRYCTCDKGVINSEGAKNCYDYHSANNKQ